MFGGRLKSLNHYESAFEDFLRSRRVSFVAVDEAKRACFRDAHLKNFDFVVYARSMRWLVDIKGRRWALRGNATRPTWENWVTQADLDALREWQLVFGEGFKALLVFAYCLETQARPGAELVHEFGSRAYVFTGVPLDDYLPAARVRSPKWGTVNLPTAEFARCAQPLAAWF